MRRTGGRNAWQAENTGSHPRLEDRCWEAEPQSEQQLANVPRTVERTLLMTRRRRKGKTMLVALWAIHR